MESDKMPIIRPIPIKTKDEPFLTAMKRWIFSVRRWEVVKHRHYILEDGTKARIPKGFDFDGA
jgi:hypothetical protein